MLENEESVNCPEVDISSSLITDTDNILGEELKTDNSTEILESKSINDIQNDSENKIPDAKWFDEYGKKLLANSSPIMFEYHKSEIETVNNIINSILNIAKLVSFVTILLVAVCIFLEKDNGAIISGAIGGLIDTILGILAGLFNTTLKSKKSYFDSEMDSTRFTTMMLLVQTISDNVKKDDIIVDILRNHFNITKN